MTRPDHAEPGPKRKRTKKEWLPDNFALRNELTYHEDRKKQETVRNIAALVFVTPEAIDPSEREIARRIILLAGLPEQGRQTLRH